MNIVLLYDSLMFCLILYDCLHFFLERGYFKFFDISGSVIPGKNASIERTILVIFSVVFRYCKYLCFF